MRSRLPPDGFVDFWILWFDTNRLTIADFRDIGVLGV
jgi:hypothetical protein